MFFKIINGIKRILSIGVSDKYINELRIETDRINLFRVKITAVTFIILELIMIAASLIVKKQRFLIVPGIYYFAMYITLIVAMLVFVYIFIKLEGDIPGNGKAINVTGMLFTAFILLWCAMISLLDQFSSGQIIVYVVAIISIAVVPLFKPVITLTVYSVTQVIFIELMPFFTKNHVFPVGNIFNSSMFILLAVAISAMRYKRWGEDFENKKIIEEKSKELMVVNSELEAANRKLEKLSQMDSLTGIYNRFMFDKTIKAEWDRCKRHSIPLSLIMIDIDFFKAFNDNYGHQAGDKCLRRVSEVLASCTKRSSDVVARYGGEEFVIILPHMKKDNAVEFARLIKERVHDLAIPHEYSSVSPFLTLSMGVNTVIPSDYLNIEGFIKATDVALYEAKKVRNKVVFVN